LWYLSFHFPHEDPEVQDAKTTHCFWKVFQAGSKLVALATHLQGIAPGAGKTTTGLLFGHTALAV